MHKLRHQGKLVIIPLLGSLSRHSNMVMSCKSVIPVLGPVMGSVRRHGRLVNHVNNERALQDTLTFVGIRSVCAGVMVFQWMFMNKPVKMVCKSNVFVGQSGVALLTSDPKC
ncbi:unnamed protein product [Sphagnum jensenii]